MQWDQKLALAIYMAKAGITQRELAERLQLSQTTISNWCQGNISITLEKAQMIAGLSGITLEEFISYGKR